MRPVLAAVAIGVAALIAPARAYAQQAGQGSTQATTSAPAAQQGVGQSVQIDRNGVLILIRSTLLALDHANRTGNYTVVRDLGAPGFQAANSPARLGEIFANLRDQKVDLSGVAVLDPQLTVLPTTAQGGMMRMAGFFPSVPTQVSFDMLFAPVEGQWRLFGIGVQLGQASPAPPTPPTLSETPAAPSASAKPEARPEQKPAQRPATSAASPASRTHPRRAAPQRSPGAPSGSPAARDAEE